MKLKKKYRVGDIIRVSFRIRNQPKFGYFPTKGKMPFWGIIGTVSDHGKYSIERLNGQGSSAWWDHEMVIGYAGHIMDHLKGKLK